jgi:hypothetical protein
MTISDSLHQCRLAPANRGDRRDIKETQEKQYISNLFQKIFAGLGMVPFVHSIDISSH